MAQLIITLPDGRSVRHALGRGPQVAGRDATCEILIDDPSASRRHARFSPRGAGYIVEDLGSKNGTLVNNAPCTDKLLKDGDQILIGSALAVFSDAEPHTAPSVVISDDLSVTHATKYVSRDQQLVLPQRRLEMIYALGERLTTLQSRDSLLNDALSICFETLHFERGAVGIRRPTQRTLDWPVVRNLRDAEGELTISRTLLARALDQGERAIFSGGDPSGTDPTMSIVQQGIRSAMCVPLHHRDEILGVIYGDRLSTTTVYTSEDVDFFAGIAQQVSIGLINTRLVDEQRQMARLNRDIEVARSIQTGLFPAALPNREGLKVAALNDPGQRVSGDYYDLIETKGGRVWFLVADVTGEGMAAALLMANLQAAVRVTIEQADDPAELLARWNDLIYSNTDPSKFITCSLALIDTEAREIRFSSAGHLPPLIRRAGDQRFSELDLAETGYPLGVVENAQFKTSVADGGREPFLLFCYTDGVIEAMNETGDMFGRDRLLEILADHAELNPHALVKQVRRSMTRFVGSAPQSDDITLLAARVG